MTIWDGWTPTIKTGYGFWAEGVRTNALEQALKQTSDPKYLEHVTNYIYEHPDRFIVQYKKPYNYVKFLIEIRLTVDTPNDFLVSKEIYEICMDQKISINPKNLDILIKKNPRWIELMNQEMQKNLK